MEMPLSDKKPMIMHVDLNSCFAMIEQQANPLIRHKPVAVAAYDTPRGIILASSYEAKALGIKLGVTVGQGRDIYPGLIVMMPDPDKYLDASRRFEKVLLRYTSNVTPKSIDEYVIDFRGSPVERSGEDLMSVGMRIKQEIKEEVGDYVTVNVGIGSNRFLAKLASGINKPDGLEIINLQNIREVYSKLSLLDLPGINYRYEARLNLAEIYTPIDFLNAPLDKLRKEVFHSINGYYWYLRLRGHEIDSVDFDRKSFSQQYALGNKTADYDELSRLLMKLCEKTGRRLRGHGYSAQGIHLWLGFKDGPSWSHGRKLDYELYSTQDIYAAANVLLKQAINGLLVTNMSVGVYFLKKEGSQQTNLFSGSSLDSRSLAVASDAVNNRYGEFTLYPALMANMEDTIIKRVAFGHVN
jgi:DNA polymerase-4